MSAKTRPGVAAPNGRAAPPAPPPARRRPRRIRSGADIKNTADVGDLLKDVIDDLLEEDGAPPASAQAGTHRIGQKILAAGKMLKQAELDARFGKPLPVGSGR